MTNAVKLFNIVVATIQAALDAEFVLTAKVVMAECLRDALVVSVVVVVVVVVVCVCRGVHVWLANSLSLLLSIRSCVMWAWPRVRKRL